jgi:hypothetical protein
MNTSQFYTENTLKDWQHVLGPKMHYHLGSQSNDDIFDQAIRNLYTYIPQNSSILDCGCGWGGPANLLQHELNATITGITNSPQQHEYTSFDTHLIDIHDFIPSQNYDIALFIESLCHFKQPDIVLRNLKYSIPKIIIKDYVWYDDWYNPQWQMFFRSKQSYHNLLSYCGYDSISIHDDTTVEVYNSSLFWYNKLIQLPHITGQLQSLYLLTQDVIDSGPDSDFVKMVTIIAH